jgi:energy-coupling factor transporter ATP-binding protein EcfA2
MRLARIDVRGLPGLEGRFSLEPAPGVNLVVGPNTSGKSSLVRAVHGLLWPATGAAARDFLAVTFTCRDGAFVAERRPDGALAWTRDGLPAQPPRLPDDHLRDRYALGLGDLVEARGSGREGAFAAEIRRQMTGGFDLDVVGNDLFRVSAAQVRARLREWRQARLDCGERERAHRELRDRERALETWRADLGAAEARTRQAEALRKALAVHDARDALAAAAGRLEAFPAALAAFRPDDPATMESLRQALAGAEAEVSAHAGRLRDAQERLRALGPVPPPEAGYPAAVDTLVEEWRQAAVAMESAAVTLAGARSQRQEAAARLRGAAPANDGGDGDGTGPDREALARLARLFVAAEEARARLTAAESLLAERLLADAGPAAPGPAQLDDSAAAVAALEAWLALSSPSPWWPLAMAAAGLLLLGGAALAGRDGAAALPALVGAALLAAGAGGAARAAAARRRRGRHTGLARQALAAAGLVDAERAVADADAGAAAAARDRLRLATARRELVGSWRDRLQAERDRAAARLRELEVEATELRRLSGVGRELDGRGVLHDMDAAARLREADGALARAAAEHGKRAANEAERGARAREALRAAGEGEPADPAAAALAVRRWQQQLEERAALELAAARAREDQAAASRRRDDDAAELARLRERLGVTGDGDDVQVSLLAARHQAWLEAAALHDAARAALGAREADADAALAALPRAELRERLDAAGDAPAVVRDLLQRIAKLEGDLERARRDRGLEQALAAEERARDRLADERANARRAALADHLLADLRRQEAATARPAVLEHATDLLRAFTQGRHRLELAAAGQDGFVAIDQASGLPQSLAELSDGTRVQLLLAVRLAFVTAMEGEQPLPLFLDEALTTTDPVRFAAVAAALGELARAQGRQVFYLTSQPGDVGAWNAALAARGLPAANVIDLATARRVAGAATPSQLATPSPAALPSPPEPAAGPDALERWRLAVGVPPLDPRRGAAAQHIDWLLPDDARLEHRLLSAGATQVGPLLASLEDLVDFGTLDEAAARRLRVRAQALESFVGAWRIGRGREVTAADLDASGVSEVMRAPLLELLARLGGDARALANRWREVPRLREKVAEGLLDHLRSAGALDERDVLEESAVLARVLGEIGRQAAGDALSEAEVGRWVARWWRAAETAAAPGVAR